VGGWFGNVGDTAIDHLARFDLASGAFDASWAPAPDGNVFALAVWDDTLSVGGEFHDIAGRPHEHFAVFGDATGPANTVAPVLAGKAVLGGTLTCLTGTWSGDPTYAYQWLRDGAAIKGATSSTHRVSRDDCGKRLSCLVKATSDAGQAKRDERQARRGRRSAAALAGLRLAGLARGFEVVDRQHRLAAHAAPHHLLRAPVGRLLAQALPFGRQQPDAGLGQAVQAAAGVHL
jgi:hypothetical protein